MAVLCFRMNPEKEGEMLTKIVMHNGETKESKTFKWATYALNLSVQLNFNKTEYNPFCPDVGANIVFLDKKLMELNDTNIFGYEESVIINNFIPRDNERFDSFGMLELDYYEDEEYEYDNINVDDVVITLDQNSAMQMVGGLRTMTATSSTAIHEALKSVTVLLNQ